mmetsp:Transcript_32480/g.76735  ORF Transcript_32480/g.76735 Transcript_32480/m.76735 type:complete len:139 (-) Transcript_32480:74-490(-)
MLCGCCSAAATPTAAAPSITHAEALKGEAAGEAAAAGEATGDEAAKAAGVAASVEVIEAAQAAEAAEVAKAAGGQLPLGCSVVGLGRIRKVATEAAGTGNAVRCSPSVPATCMPRLLFAASAGSLPVSVGCRRKESRS